MSRIAAAMRPALYTASIALAQLPLSVYAFVSGEICLESRGRRDRPDGTAGPKVADAVLLVPQR